MTSLARRPLRPVLLSLVLVATGLTFQAAPSTLPIPRPEALRPQTAKAVTCATNPTFTGKLTQTLVNSGTPPTVTRITSANVYGWISNVDGAWSCTASVRYSGLAWNTAASTGTFDWGNLINSTTTPCNWVVGSTDYLKANSGSTCATSDTMFAQTVTLDAERTYSNSTNHTAVGQFSFAHSDCDTYHGAEPVKTAVTFSTSSTANRPDASNCDPITIDSTNTSQTIVYDKTAPTIAFDWPTVAGPTVIATAGVGVGFDATDALAGFDATHTWSLQRQKATWSGSVCGTFASDGSATTGTTNLANQVASQGLVADGSCYRWTLAATDANGNVATVQTSGIVRVDASGVLGQPGQHSFESWDLGAGDGLSVDVATGNLVVNHPIVSLPIQGSSVGIDLTYNRLDPADVGMTPGWRLNMLRRLTINADSTVTFTDGSGARHKFVPTGTVGTVTSYSRPDTIYATLVMDTSVSANEFILTYRDGSKDKFDIAGSSGLLVRQEDRFANGVTLAYTSGNLTSITDTAGSRSIALGWTSGNLTSITDWANVSGGQVQTSGSGNRVTTFFYSGGQLIGWADPLNTSGSCPTGGSHLTCLTYTSGGLTAIGKTQTYETFSAGTLGSSTRSISTTVTYAGSDVDTITDAEGAATTFRHTATWATTVTRPGTPASVTTYTRLGAADDVYARIGSVKRKLGAAQIEQTTTYDTAYPIERATITDNVGGGALERSTTTTYVASSLGLVARIDAPLDGTYRHYTDYTYNANNDVTQEIASRQGDGTLRTTTRYCYNSSTCNTSDADPKLYRVITNYVDGTAGGANGQYEDVTVTYQVDSHGQRTRETRSNYSGSTLLDSAATGWTYDTFGNQTAEIRNYIDGTVSAGGDDITPNATTNARTDLTTTFGYDTAGNRVSTADPRRAIEAALGTSLAADDYSSRTVYDALNRGVIEQLPTTPSGGDCTPAGATCRQASTTYDEFGQARETRDIPDVVTATVFDKVGRAAATYEDPPPAGSAEQTAATTYDAQGRVLTAKDREQAKAGSTLGATVYTYDELGRQTDTTEASGSSPNVASTTHTTYDNLDRTLTEETGYGSSPDIGQTTTTTYDIGDRVTKVDDEFTCASTTYDWRGLALTVIEGQTSGTCTGSGSRTTTNTYDALGRLTQSSVTGGDILAAPTYDAAGRQLSTSSTTAGTTTASTSALNPLDQVIAETRSDGGTATSWTRMNYDAAGNPTDRCVWNATPTELCKAVGTTMSPEPAVRTTTAYDARNNRISLKTPGAGETTYDPAHNYAIDKAYTPTKLNGSNQVTAEHLTDYGYDSRHRLISIDESVCPVTAGTHSCTSTAVVTGSDTYTYDDNDNRTQVSESKDGGTAVTTTYCYDALNRLIAARLTTACTSSPTEAYTYDLAGNRIKTVISGTTTWFGHNTKGQLCKTGATSGTDCASANITYDATGRTQTWNGWTFTYDGDGRLATACKVAGCATNDKVTMRYDGEGRRIELVVRTGATTTTTTFRYQGETIAQELTDTGGGATVTREYVADELGAIVKVCDPNCVAPTTTYLVTYNGHGDALALWRINADGTLTLANSYTYDTWGKPTTTVASGFSDLKFRFLYVGAHDVQWDDLGVGLGLTYMHARHYSPALARFLQPDPSAAEANLYGYAGNGPPTRTDPSGLYTPNEVEKSYCLIPWHWGVCVAANVLSGQALAEAQQAFPPSTLHNGIGDAYRHCCWSGWLAAFYGQTLAKEVTDNHEAWPGNPPREKRMDLANNWWGRKFAQAIGWFDFNPKQTIRDSCRKAANSGQLQTRLR